jgi:hypothetical protein
MTAAIELISVAGEAGDDCGDYADLQVKQATTAATKLACRRRHSSDHADLQVKQAMTRATRLAASRAGTRRLTRRLLL